MNKIQDIVKCTSFPEYDVLYCDPPWEDRMVKFFQTQTKKQAGVIVDNNINDIITSLAKLSNTKKPVYIEYSIKGSDFVINTMTKYGHTFKQKQELIQSNNKPYVIMSFNTDLVIPKNLKGIEIIKYVIKKNQLIFDPFAGIGFTARVVLELGAKYIGYELNPKRFERLENICKKYR